MKQSLQVIIEQVESGDLFYTQEKIEIIRAIVKSIRAGWPEHGSPNDNLANSLECACKEWEDKK